MPIDFFDIASDDDWEPSVVTIGPADRWYAGGPLADAPVDVEATCEGNVWENTVMDPEFRMRGLRLAPNFGMPRCSHNQHKLLIVYAGAIDVTSDDADGSPVTERVTGPGGFVVVDADTPHVVAAGPDGARLTEQWDYRPQPDLVTTWYDVGWVSG